MQQKAQKIPPLDQSVLHGLNSLIHVLLKWTNKCSKKHKRPLPLSPPPNPWTSLFYMALTLWSMSYWSGQINAAKAQKTPPSLPTPPPHPHPPPPPLNQSVLHGLNSLIHVLLKWTNKCGKKHKRPPPPPPTPPAPDQSVLHGLNSLIHVLLKWINKCSKVHRTSLDQSAVHGLYSLVHVLVTGVLMIQQTWPLHPLVFLLILFYLSCSLACDLWQGKGKARLI